MAIIAFIFSIRPKSACTFIKHKNANSLTNNTCNVTCCMPPPKILRHKKLLKVGPYILSSICSDSKNSSPGVNLFTVGR